MATGAWSGACAWRRPRGTGRGRAGGAWAVVLCAALLAAMLPSLHAETLHVDALEGDDVYYTGSREHPWRTVARALEAVRPGDTLLLRGGVHVVPERLHFSDRSDVTRVVMSAGGVGDVRVGDGPVTTIRGEVGGARVVLATASDTPPQLSFEGGQLRVENVWLHSGAEATARDRAVAWHAPPAVDDVHALADRVELRNCTWLGHDEVVVRVREFALVQHCHFLMRGEREAARGLRVEPAAGRGGVRAVLDNNVFAISHDSAPRPAMWLDSAALTTTLTNNVVTGGFDGVQLGGGEHLLANNLFWNVHSDHYWPLSSTAGVGDVHFVNNVVRLHETHRLGARADERLAAVLSDPHSATGRPLQRAVHRTVFFGAARGVRVEADSVVLPRVEERVQVGIIGRVYDMNVRAALRTLLRRTPGDLADAHLRLHRLRRLHLTVPKSSVLFGAGVRWEAVPTNIGPSGVPVGEATLITQPRTFDVAAVAPHTMSWMRALQQVPSDIPTIDEPGELFPVLEFPNGFVEQRVFLCSTDEDCDYFENQMCLQGRCAYSVNTNCTGTVRLLEKCVEGIMRVPGESCCCADGYCENDGNLNTCGSLLITNPSWYNCSGCSDCQFVDAEGRYNCSGCGECKSTQNGLLAPNVCPLTGKACNESHCIDSCTLSRSCVDGEVLLKQRLCRQYPICDVNEVPCTLQTCINETIPGVTTCEVREVCPLDWQCSAQYERPCPHYNCTGNCSTICAAACDGSEVCTGCAAVDCDTCSGAACGDCCTECCQTDCCNGNCNITLGLCVDDLNCESEAFGLSCEVCADKTCITPCNATVPANTTCCLEYASNMCDPAYPAHLGALVCKEEWCTEFPTALGGLLECDRACCQAFEKCRNETFCTTTDDEKEEVCFIRPCKGQKIAPPGDQEQVRNSLHEVFGLTSPAAPRAVPLVHVWGVIGAWVLWWSSMWAREWATGA